MKQNSFQLLRDVLPEKRACKNGTGHRKSVISELDGGKQKRVQTGPNPTYSHYYPLPEKEAKGAGYT